jgi:HEAT repeat protein
MDNQSLFARVRQCCVCLALLGMASLSAADAETWRVGSLDFFGTSGIDVASVRAAIALHAGDTITPDQFDDLKARVSTAVAGVIGQPVTDVSLVCCNGAGGALIYVGLPGTNVHDVQHLPTPTGSVCLPAAAVRLYDRAMDAMQKSVEAGDASEDDSKGYALSHYPEYRDRQVALREYALAHGRQVRSALGDCPQAQNRAAAADLLGYANRSRAQIDALVHAANDTDRIVRNNAVRALGVLASAQSRTEMARIPTKPFVAMLNSGTWEDRNKAGMLLSALAVGADAPALADMRRTAMDSLVEMARWQDSGHAYAYRVLLGRLAGFDETRLKELATAGEVETIIAAAQRR